MHNNINDIAAQIYQDQYHDYDKDTDIALRVLADLQNLHQNAALFNYVVRCINQNGNFLPLIKDVSEYYYAVLQVDQYESTHLELRKSQMEKKQPRHTFYYLYPTVFTDYKSAFDWRESENKKECRPDLIKTIIICPFPIYFPRKLIIINLQDLQNL